jgi:hypothetical protein
MLVGSAATLVVGVAVTPSDCGDGDSVCFMVGLAGRLTGLGAGFASAFVALGVAFAFAGDNLTVCFPAGAFSAVAFLDFGGVVFLGGALVDLADLLFAVLVFDAEDFFFSFLPAVLAGAFFFVVDLAIPPAFFVSSISMWPLHVLVVDVFEILKICNMEQLNL